jgi:hypothetical protein
MPAGEGQERERFAAAVEHGVDAVPPGDEELRRELELVALLRESRAALAPSADESARMRAKVMAAAASMLPANATQSNDGSAEQSDDDAPTLADNPVVVADEPPTAEQPTNVVPIGRGRRGRHRFPRSAVRSDRRGQLTITAAAALMVLAATGGGAMFSQGALPGDSLYGVKQTTESALVGLTPGQGNKAQRQLDYAATRLDEVRELNGGPAEAADRGADIKQALRGFNDQTAAGSRMWLASASSGNTAELGALANWAQAQSQRLAALRSSMPASAQPDADYSLRLLEDLRTRAQSLNNRQGCDRIISGDADQLGPLPAKGACDSKENTLEPTTRSVAPPSSPARSGRSSESSSSEPQSSDSSSSGSDRADNESDEPKAPGLPGLGGLTGNGSNPGDGVGPLPGRAPASNKDLVPNHNPGQQQPGLQLPLLPIQYQQVPGPPQTNG